MSQQTKDVLLERKKHIRRSRLKLFLLLIPELFILLLHYPGFFGVEAVETALLDVRDFLAGLLWPAGMADMVTYRGAVYRLADWFLGLQHYKLVVRVIIWLAPALYVLTFLREALVDLRIRILARPKRDKKSAPRGWQKRLRELRDGLRESGLTRRKAQEVDRFCQEARERCGEGFYDWDPGLRVQIPGEGYGPRGEEYILHWDSEGSIDLTSVLGRPATVRLEGGKPFLYSGKVKSPAPLGQYIPSEFVSPDDEGDHVICYITWLGG